MLTHPTLDQLRALQLNGMLKALQEQVAGPDLESLSFLERLALLLNRDITERDNRRLATRLRFAKLKPPATLEDLDCHTPRQLDRTLVRSLPAGDWVKDPLNVLITGPTGVGKSYRACALAQTACRQGYKACYQRLPRRLTRPWRSAAATAAMPS